MQIALLAAAFIVAVLFIQFVARPIRRLTVAAERISVGEVADLGASRIYIARGTQRSASLILRPKLARELRHWQYSKGARQTPAALTRYRKGRGGNKPLKPSVYSPSAAYQRFNFDGDNNEISHGYQRRYAPVS